MERREQTPVEALQEMAKTCRLMSADLLNNATNLIGKKHRFRDAQEETFSHIRTSIRTASQLTRSAEEIDEIIASFSEPAAEQPTQNPKP